MKPCSTGRLLCSSQDFRNPKGVTAFLGVRNSAKTFPWNGVTNGMARLSRRLLFTARTDRPDPVREDIFPQEVRPAVMRTLWLGLLVALAGLIAIIVLVWGICGV